MDSGFWKTMVDIYNEDHFKFFLQVGIPIVVGIAALLGTITGYQTLRENYVNRRQTEDIQNDLADKSKAINSAFEKINEQESILTQQKVELTQQQKLTLELNSETIRQREFNELLNKIQLLALATRNGDREKYYEFYSLINEKGINDDLHTAWEQEYNGLRQIWQSELERVNFFRLTAFSKEAKKWSLEYLYVGLSSILNNTLHQYNKMDIIAYFNEVEICNSKYFVETLFKIAVESKNISYSILAVKAICALTNYEPYPQVKYVNRLNSLLNDIPDFLILKEWWNKKGSKNDEYKCPFNKIVLENVDYYIYDCTTSHPEFSEGKRLNFLNETLKQYPLLSRTYAELAYYLLKDQDTYPEVERLALESIKRTDMEPLPFLLIAVIAYEKGDYLKYRDYILLSSKAIGRTAFGMNLYNEKLKFLYGISGENSVYNIALKEK
jgi:hypothetical protein